MNHLEKAKELDLTADQYVLIGGSVLDIHGIRKSNDIDVVVSTEAFATLKDRGWEVDEEFKVKWGRERLVHDVFEVYTDLYWERTDYFLRFEAVRELANQIDGVNTFPLGLLILAKLDTKRDKDLADIALIEQYFADQNI